MRPSPGRSAVIPAGARSSDVPDRNVAGAIRAGWPAWLRTAAVPVVVVLCYLPLIFPEYATGEDFRLLADHDRGATFRPLLLAEGRPVFALWARLVFGGLHDIASLRWVRLASILMLGAFAAVLAAAFRRAGWGRVESGAAGVLAVTLPPYQLYVANAAMGAKLPALLLAAGAAFAGLRSTDEAPRAVRFRHQLAGWLMLVIALATYQSAGLVYVVFAAILLVAANPSRAVYAARLRALSGIAAAAFSVAFGLFLAGRNAYLPWLLGAPRGDLEFAPLAKAGWFVLYPLPHALNLWKLHPNLYLALGLLIALVAGLFLHLRATEGRWLRVTLALLLLPLCYLPNLIVVENRSSFRTMPALAVLVLVYYLVILRGQLGATRPALYRVALAVLLAVGLFSAGTGPLRLIAQPQVRELAALRATLSGLPPTYAAIGVTPASFRDALAPRVLYEEFGYPSTAEPFATESTYFVLRELRPGVDTASLRVWPAADAGQPLDTIIDWGRELRAFAASERGRPSPGDPVR